MYICYNPQYIYPCVYSYKGSESVIMNEYSSGFINKPNLLRRDWCISFISLFVID